MNLGDLALAVGLVLSSGGTGSWTPPFDTTVWMIDTTSAIFMDFAPTIVYPASSVPQVLFATAQAGQFQTALQVQGGVPLYFAVPTPAAYKVALFFELPQPPSP